MIRAGLGLWIAVSITLTGADAPAAEPPRSVDPRLLFERIAAEPEIVTPTGLAVDRRGRVLVIESHTHFRPRGYKGPAADRIRVFEDRDHDGRPECVGTFFEGTRFTMNLAVARDGSVFVATRWAVYHLDDQDGDGRADGTAGGIIPAPIVRLDTPGDYPHNGLSGFAFDSLEWVYFGLGENLGADYRLIGADGTTLSGGGEGGNIYRCRPDGTKLEKVATGFWNPFHLTFDAFGRLFAVDNDPDSRPPCRLLHIVDGGDYGYRFRNGRKGLHPFTAWNGELPGTLGMVAGTGEAPSGVVAYESKNLPADYRGALLVTSWGDHRIERYDLQPRGASFQATMKPVVVGGDDFRPVGIAVAPDGSLYMSDWVDKDYNLHGKGRIWRLRNAHEFKGPYNMPESDMADPRTQAGMLARVAASGMMKDQFISQSLRDASPDVRAMAVRVAPKGHIEFKRLAASDKSPLVRAEAMRRLADPSAKDLLRTALESDDPFVQQAAREGLRHSFAMEDLIAMLADPECAPSQRLGLLLILRDRDRPEARALLPKFLADPDPSIHFAAIQWVGEHRLEAFRAPLLAGLTSTAVTRELFEATLAALEQLDGRRKDPNNELSGEEYIVSLLKNSGTPSAVLRRGLRMLRPDHPSLTLARLKHFLDSSDPSIRIEAVRSLSQSPHAGRFDLLAKLAGEAATPEPVRAEAIAALADDASHHRARLLGLATNQASSIRHEALRSLRGVALSSEELAHLRDADRGDDVSLALIDRLKTGKSAPLQSDRNTAPAQVLDAWLARLEGPADPSAGERIFFHTKGPGCYRCHPVDGRGGRAGPDLSTLASTTDRRRLVESIVAPSREIAPQFVPWSVARTDGTVFTGILLEQSPEGVLVFADSQGRRIAVKSDEIAERKPQTTSIMPDDLVTTMTIQEFRDLIAFLNRLPKTADPKRVH
jgi:putative membrane-bound dehydrogenase-like protein